MSDYIPPSSTWPNYSTSNVQKAADKPKDNTLDKDDFLKILVTQLQNQDPMQPLEDKDFIAQMAQFSSVEQLYNLTDAMTKLSQNLGMASAMIGKSIEWNGTTDSGSLVTRSGVVDSIVIKNGAQFARVGDEDVSLNDIVSLQENSGQAGPDSGETASGSGDGTPASSGGGEPAGE